MLWFIDVNIEYHRIQMALDANIANATLEEQKNEMAEWQFVTKTMGSALVNEEWLEGKKNLLIQINVTEMR